MANVAVEIQRMDDNLKFGKSLIPIGNATSVWVKNAKERIVTVHCEKQGYHTFLEFEMRNVEEMNRLIKEIVKDDRIKIALPHFNNMKLTPDNELSIAFEDDEDQALYEAFTKPYLFAADSVKDAYCKIRDKMAQPVTLNMDLATEIQRIRNYRFLANAAYDHASDGFKEFLLITDSEKPIMQVGHLNQLTDWMKNPTEAGDQIPRYAGILARQFSYRSTYRKNVLPAFYNHVVGMGVFEPYLQQIFGSYRPKKEC